MNQLSELYSTIKDIADQDVNVNKVVKSSDLNKETIFPLVNINVQNGGFTNGSTIIFNVELSCFDIRDINKEVITDDFWGQDNEVDNHNLCLAILNTIWTKLYVDFEDKDITSSENPSFELGSFTGAKLLDGAILTFTAEVPNTTLDIC